MSIQTPPPLHPTATLPEGWEAQVHRDGDRNWKWYPFLRNDDLVWCLFAQAYDDRGDEYVDECWCMDELAEAGGPFTEAALAQAAMSFEAAYGPAM